MTRKAIRYGIFLVISLIVLRIVWGISVTVFRIFFPKPPPAPTVAFDKLPKLPFPEKINPQNLTFTLETPEGGFPKLAQQAKVYLMPKVSPNLLSSDAAREKASELGFSPNETEVSETVYRFSHKSSPATLEINIISGVFSISYNLKSDPSPLDKRPPTSEAASNLVKSFLGSADLMSDDLTGPITYDFLKLEGDKFISALSLSESQLVKVYLFRKSYDELPSLTSDPDKANVWFIVSGDTSKVKGVLAGQFHYFPVDENKSSTYPLKTSEEAWNELTAGKEYIAKLGTNKEGDNIKIRRVYLAHYDPGLPVEFFQPIIVFEGDRGFTAYVPAVNSTYYGD
jgi:hypothetical protein